MLNVSRRIFAVGGLVVLLACGRTQGGFTSRDDLPKGGRTHSSAAEAARALGIDVPDCAGISLLNEGEPGTSVPTLKVLYGHGESARFWVDLALIDTFTPASKLGPPMSYASPQSLSIHGKEAVAFENDKPHQRVPVPGSSGEVATALARSYVAWVEGTSHVHIASDEMSLNDLIEYAQRCVMRSPT